MGKKKLPLALKIETIPAKNKITHSRNPTSSMISTSTPRNIKDFLKSTVSLRQPSTLGLISLREFWKKQEEAKLIYSWSTRICKLKTERLSTVRPLIWIAHLVMRRMSMMQRKRTRPERKEFCNSRRNFCSNNRRLRILVIFWNSFRKSSENFKGKTMISRSTLEKTKNYHSKTQQQEYQNWKLSSLSFKWKSTSTKISIKTTRTWKMRGKDSQVSLPKQRILPIIIPKVQFKSQISTKRLLIVSMTASLKSYKKKLGFKT